MSYVIEPSILTKRRKDLTGKKFGYYTVIGPNSISGNTIKWLCKCKCGTEKLVYGNNLNSGHTVSCGCYHKENAAKVSKKKAKNLIDKRFERLVVLKRDGSKFQKAMWLCKCDCGNEVRVATGSLISGNSKSCGCIQKEMMHDTKWNHNLTQEERENNRKRDLDPRLNIWRKAVYKRDGYKCRICNNNRSGKIVAHHKNGWDKFKEQRFVLKNGDTCCIDCHKKFHAIYGYGNNTKKQWKEFINLI